MPKVLVLFHSRTGTTAHLADAIAEGARSVRFTEVDVRRIDDLASETVVASQPAWQACRARLQQDYRTLQDVEALTAYDAIIVGSPTRHGVMSAELTDVFERLEPLRAAGAFVDTVGSAFASMESARDSHELALLSIMAPMCQLGMILVPPGYTDPVMLAGGSPYGATASTDLERPGDADLAAARHQGRRVAKVAEWVRHARGHEAGAHHHH